MAANVAAEAAKPTAILLLAHGGSAQWNQEVERVRQTLTKAGYANEVAFGMADVSAMDRALAKLEALRPKPKQVVCVPLLVNSRSELYEHFEYVLGKRPKPSDVFINAVKEAVHDEARYPKNQHKAHHHNAIDSRRVATKLPLKLSPALDDHPHVARILWDRAKTVSRNPDKETVILISHGPYTDAMDILWMQNADQVARQLKELGGFAEVKAFNLRDDSAREIREKKAKEIRSFVSQAQRRGQKILVLPHLVATNGIEKRLTETLGGLFYKMSRQALLPHPLIAQWVLSQVKNNE
ncbi:MAG: hypothetical protein HY401_09965 [Elusimicrobia bacterium]|nr:hypothetical protein [Elusimicrobiota bacterium]